MEKTGRLICYGDSNTYGYDPQSFMGTRYPKEVRWTGIVGRESGWKVKNYGLNGRTIPQNESQIQAVIDIVHKYGQEEIPVLFLVMLGTNDLLTDALADAGKTAEKMGYFLERIMQAESVRREKVSVWLIAPPILKPGSWIENDRQITESERLGERLALLAKRLKITFTDAGKWELPAVYDGVHLSEEGHRRFAEEIIKDFLKKKGKEYENIGHLPE